MEKQLYNKLRQIISLAEECQAALTSQKPKKIRPIAQLQNKPTTANTKGEAVDFGLNSRAFFKGYGKNLSGPKKFVLVVSYLAKGKKEANITSDEVKNCWNKHKRLLGGKLTTGIYGTRAKEGGWLDAAKNGTYHLTSRWQEIFN